MRRLAIVLCTLLALGAVAPAGAQKPAPASPFGPAWSALLGDWVTEGKPESGTGTFSLHPELDGKVLVRRNHAEYPPQNGRPAVVHDDLMVITPGADARHARAQYYDNEGHVISYQGEWSADGQSLALVSEAAPGTPTFRLTYRFPSAGQADIAFEMATPDQPGAFMPYLAGKARRKGP